MRSIRVMGILTVLLLALHAGHLGAAPLFDLLCAAIVAFILGTTFGRRR